MKDVLNEGLINSLVSLQPKKVVTGYVSPLRAASGPCYNATCQGGCKTSGCRGTSRQKKK